MNGELRGTKYEWRRMNYEERNTKEEMRFEPALQRHFQPDSGFADLQNTCNNPLIFCGGIEESLDRLIRHSVQ